MASWLVRSSLEPWPGTLCCVLGQNTLLSRCLSQVHPGVQMGIGALIARGNPAMDSVASHPVGSRNTPSRFMLLKPG